MNKDNLEKENLGSSYSMCNVNDILFLSVPDFLSVVDSSINYLKSRKEGCDFVWNEF